MTPPLRPPLKVALAQSVRELPTGPGWSYEPKFDGHRMLVFRTADGVVLQARSGRIVTAAFPDLVEAALAVPSGCVLDGEVVVWTGGRTDFAAVQRRAAATPTRAALLARRLPASYAAFDVLAEGDEDVRRASYSLRRARLLAVLGELGPPLQPVPATSDLETALTWYETLPASGVEGLVAKRLDSPYRPGARAWRKLRHTDTWEAVVVGFVGPARRPTALVLVLPGDDAVAVSSPLGPALRAEAGRVGLRPSPGTPTAIAPGWGEVPYVPVEPGHLLAEVERGTVRHPVTTVLRLREGGA
ncbi:ATP-dependent DNA ligase [Streptomyces sp. CBMA152]|uniref:ATP-dependent DNA ligase n=1 Tax=Streptomyces sp. CBMA152 TaxID=1896312 RepID=UPI001660258E|nr:ATP-dependent DNA ligase [Streptomyces sp. CBMA152]